MSGQLFVTSGRGSEKVFIRITAYLLGKPNTVDDLRGMVSRTLAELDLRAEIDF